MLETTIGTHLHSLIFSITQRRYSNKEAICYELQDYAIKVLRSFDSKVAGVIKDDTFFAIIFTFDETTIRLMKTSS